MKKNILLPIDFSDNALSAVVYALRLYANESCTFYLLHSTFILDAGSRTYIMSNYVDEQRKATEIRLTELKVQTEIANANDKHSFEIILSKKELKIAVKREVENHTIDMVVMGTKGTTDAIDYFLGSNTVKVIKKIKNCPVLIVPDEFEFVEPKQIAFPTDYNRCYEHKEIRPLEHIVELFHSKIRVVHINVERNLTENQVFNKAQLGNYLATCEHSFHWLPEYTTKSKAIATFIEDLGIDMLAMVNYEHGLFESFVNEPVMKKLAFHPTVPILVIPE